MKSRNILLLTSLLGSFLLSFFLHQSWNFNSWLDTLFLVGLLLLVITAIMVLVEVEFFVTFINSFTYFFGRINKKEQIILESEKRTHERINYQKNFPSRKPLFQIGILLCVISLLISTTIYYFGR
ncbi:DUF3899 domain-containing protein [Psychrobacillus sp.]|uniref:DUF3899 domain-containing protein n=1 Tax=Psychrobacillus sp. TaxID=1871623 RepID=UPI0028BEE360|nr:DUF3899 domain-containing protein [Psychrobacillus sp.]